MFRSMSELKAVDAAKSDMHHLDGSQLRALAIANQMRGWVGIAFKDCEINQEDSERLLRALPECHLFLIKDGKMMPMTNASPEAEETSHASIRRVGRLDNERISAATG